jgi:hypothetical protein
MMVPNGHSGFVVANVDIDYPRERASVGAIPAPPHFP